MTRVRLLTSADGYRYICVGHPSDGDAAVVPEYRLAAYAWGLLDGLGDSREIHHVDRCRAHTAEGNLVALSRDDHIEQHVTDALDRGERPPAWVIAALPRERREALLDGDGQLRETEGSA